LYGIILNGGASIKWSRVAALVQKEHFVRRSQTQMEENATAFRTYANLVTMPGSRGLVVERTS